MSVAELRPGTLLTTADVSKLLNVPEPTVGNWASKGYPTPDGKVIKLKAFRCGRLLRFTPAAVDEFLAECEQAAA